MEKRESLYGGRSKAFEIGYMFDKTTGDKFQIATLKSLRDLVTEQENCELITMEDMKRFDAQKRRIELANLAYIAGREARELDGDNNCLEQRLSEYMERIKSEHMKKIILKKTNHDLPQVEDVDNYRNVPEYERPRSTNQKKRYVMSTPKTKRHIAKEIFEFIDIKKIFKGMIGIGATGLITSFVGLVENRIPDASSLGEVLLAISATIAATGGLGYGLTKDDDKGQDR